MVPRIYWQSPPFSSLVSEELECGLLKITPKRPAEVLGVGILISYSCGQGQPHSVVWQLFIMILLGPYLVKPRHFAL